MTLRIASRPLKTLKLLKTLIPFDKPIEVQRITSEIPYMEKTGWKLDASTLPAEWRGYYRTRVRSYKGKIEMMATPQFYIYKPPAGLTTRHSHKLCFHPRPDGWCFVHFSVVPKDLSSGVIKLERILYEAFLQTA